MNRKTRNEIFLIAGLCLVSLLLFAGQKMNRKKAQTAEVSVDGVVTASYPLDREIETVIEGVNGGENRLKIQNHSVMISEASCPDKVCVRQGAVFESGQTIVCLPNRVVITVK